MLPESGTRHPAAGTVPEGDLAGLLFRNEDGGLTRFYRPFRAMRVRWAKSPANARCFGVLARTSGKVNRPGRPVSRPAACAHNALKCTAFRHARSEHRRVERGTRRTPRSDNYCPSCTRAASSDSPTWRTSWPFTRYTTCSARLPAWSPMRSSERSAHMMLSTAEMLRASSIM